MEKYVAPVEDMSFILTHLLDIDNYLKSINNKELSLDSLKMIIEEAGKFASDELDTINQVGDQEGIKLENGVVRMPESFIKAYQKFVDIRFQGFFVSFNTKGILRREDVILNFFYISFGLRENYH